VDSKFIQSPKLRIISIILIVVGIAAIVFGFLSNPQRTWANVLISNYYFISLAIGATFFIAIQAITQSGWSSMFKRIPEAIGGYLPYAAVLMLLFVLFGAHSVYHWAHEEIVKSDVLLTHKSPYLNMPFFITRFVIFFALWILLTTILRRFSLKEDQYGGIEYFEKSEFVSKVYIFVLALTFSLATFDWTMSIDTHWFSTIYALKNFMSAFFHGSAAIILIVLLLNKSGHFKELNSSHLHDFSKYLFMLATIWGYMWFSQYFLIWFSNLPEETVYYVQRVGGEWRLTFYSEIVINWMFPFLFLMLNKIAKNKTALLTTSIVVLIGFWIDIYMQVMPGTTGINSIGIIEIGTYCGFLGIFIFAVSRALSQANLVPKNHPYLEESILHKLH